jgi:hypothetical protein
MAPVRNANRMWRAFGFDGVAEAHQPMNENRHRAEVGI